MMQQQDQWKSTETLTAMSMATPSTSLHDEMESALAMPVLERTSLSRTSLQFPVYYTSSDYDDDEDDADDFMAVDVSESRHMNMPRRSSYMDTSKAFMVSNAIESPVRR